MSLDIFVLLLDVCFYVLLIHTRIMCLYRPDQCGVVRRCSDGVFIVPMSRL